MLALKCFEEIYAALFRDALSLGKARNCEAEGRGKLENRRIGRVVSNLLQKSVKPTSSGWWQLKDFLFSPLYLGKRFPN